MCWTEGKVGDPKVCFSLFKIDWWKKKIMWLKNQLYLERKIKNNSLVSTNSQDHINQKTRLKQQHPNGTSQNHIYSVLMNVKSGIRIYREVIFFTWQTEVTINNHFKYTRVYESDTQGMYSTGTVINQHQWLLFDIFHKVSETVSGRELHRPPLCLRPPLPNYVPPVW